MDIGSSRMPLRISFVERDTYLMSWSPERMSRRQARRGVGESSTRNVITSDFAVQHGDPGMLMLT